MSCQGTLTMAHSRPTVASDFVQSPRRWAPELIPASVRRPPEDRIRIRIFAHHPMYLQETVECFEDLAKTQGGEVEGPVVLAPKLFKMYINKSPKGHKKSKYHKVIIEYHWQLDYYPPKEGGLEAVMKLNIPYQVHMDLR
ncbi:unnamed protein product [Effrenium voratum]|nr:unnamed protein product [Effrenium voratum]